MRIEHINKFFTLKELKSGDVFKYDYCNYEAIFIKTTIISNYQDINKYNYEILCIDILNGTHYYFSPEIIVEKIDGKFIY